MERGLAVFQVLRSESGALRYAHPRRVSACWSSSCRDAPPSVALDRHYRRALRLQESRCQTDPRSN